LRFVTCAALSFSQQANLNPFCCALARNDYETDYDQMRCSRRGTSMSARWALQILEQQKTSIERKLLALGTEEFNLRENALSWTIIEVVDHLRKVGSEFVDGIAASRSLLTKISLAERVKALLLIGFMLLPSRVKIPNGAAVHPDVELDRAVVLAGWTQTRARLIRVVTELRSEGITTGVIRHPVSGWMGVTGASWFLAAHMIHHRYQLRRVLKRGTKR
jgi:hypothetical protein